MVAVVMIIKTISFIYTIIAIVLFKDIACNIRHYYYYYILLLLLVLDLIIRTAVTITLILNHYQQ